MLKKFTWIAALFAALAMVFGGCTQLGEGLGDVERAAANPIVDGAKYLEISKRVNGWDSLDIRAGKAKNLDNFTEGAEHTITIYGGKAVAGKNVYLGNTDDNYSTNWGYVAVKADGTFVITAKVPWAQIASATNNKRISVDAPSAGGPAAFFIYEVVINDGKDDIYKLSEDEEIQGLDNGAEPFPDDTVSLTWWVKAGGPTITVVEAGAADPVEVSFDPDNGGKIDKKKATPGTKLGTLPKAPEKAGYAFVGWFDADDEEYTSASTVIVAEGAKTLALKAKWALAGKDDVVRLGDTIVHFQPNLVARTETGWSFQGTVTEGAAKYDAQTNDYNGGRSRYEFPVAKATPLIKEGEDFNVIELTINSDIDFGVTLKEVGAGTDIARYPPGAGNAYVDLKAGDNTFKVAIEDLNGNGIEFERRLKGDAATIKLVKAVFSKETTYTVTFDGSAQIRATDVPTQKILAGKKAKEPSALNASSWIVNNNLNVFDFLGWYLDGKLYDFDALVEKDIDLVSKWGVVYKRIVTFNLNGATFEDGDGDPWAGDTQELNVGVTNPPMSDIVFPATLKTKPASAGTFAGWFDVSVSPPKMYYNGITDAVVSSNVEKDVTLTASFLVDIDVPLVLASDEGTHEATFGNHPTGTLTSGKLSVDFTTGTTTSGNTNRKAIFFALTDAQVTALNNASIITVTVTLSSTATGGYRCGFVNKTLGSGWDATALPALSNTDPVTDLALSWGASKGNGWKWFVIQSTDATGVAGTIVIESIVISAL
jgi:uncharacterized repeat protein (TIGR02543 family)